MKMPSNRWRFILTLLLGILLFTSLSVRAHDGHDHDDDVEESFEAPLEDAAPVEKKPKTIVNFTPTALKAPFLEQFTSDWKSRWTISQAKKVIDGEEDDLLLRYRGEWAVEEPTVLPGMVGDSGLVAKTPAAHAAISATFDTPIKPKGKSLVVQYEVKLQNGLECGGAYMKLLRATKDFDGTKFEEKSPYVIMFGPDKCGSTNKVHFIFKHKNPKTGEYEEKHVEGAPPAKSDKLSNLYTLIVNPDNTFEILINNESAKKGSLLSDFVPAVNPPKEIDDPKDSKPASWVDEEEMSDPDAKKPADWDEDAPEYIADVDAEKPEDWLDDESATIPDPEAVQPEDWDEEEDGEWVAPSIQNPKCESGNCGEWKRPQIKNPEYKGKWKAPKIPNPAYKGVWAPRKIANPNYFEDKHPSNFESIGALGFEIWTMQENILFDNIYIGHSASDAKKLAEESWAVKYAIEKAEEEAEAPKTPETPKAEKSASGFSVGKIMDSAKAIWEELKTDPVKAIEHNPYVAIGLVGVLGTILLITAVTTSASEPAPKPKSKKKEKKVEEKEEKEDEKKETDAEVKEEKKEGAKKRQTPRKDE